MFVCDTPLHLKVVSVSCLHSFCFIFQVEVVIDGVKEEGAESGKNGSELKVLPPWMIKDGMNLTKEQRGEKIEPQKLEISEAKDDKKQDSKDDQSVQVSSGMDIYWTLE